MSNNYSPRRANRRSAPGSLRQNSAGSTNANPDHNGIHLNHGQNQILNTVEWPIPQPTAISTSSSSSSSNDSSNGVTNDMGIPYPSPHQQQTLRPINSNQSSSRIPVSAQQGPFLGYPDYTRTPVNSNIPQTKPNDTVVCNYGCCHREIANDYIYKEAYLKGTHSDCKIKAFNKVYKFHKLFLSRSGYFNSLFKWSRNTKINDLDLIQDDVEEDEGDGDLDWESETKTPLNDCIELNFDDERITKESFELATSRLYYFSNLAEEIKIPHSMVAIGQYLDIPEIVNHSLQHILSSLNMSNLSEYLEFATSYNYGIVSDQIIEFGKGILCSDGWQMGAEKWDNLPLDIVAEVVGEDYFFVPTEWDRCMFIIKLLERRLERADDDSSDDGDDNLQLLRDVLNNKIYYVHFTPEQLFELETYYDINGDTYINTQILHMALWKAMNLRSTILQSLESNSNNIEKEIISTSPPSKSDKWFKIPMQDETLSGLPRDLHKSLLQNLNSSKPIPSSASSMSNNMNEYEMTTKATETQQQSPNELGSNSLSSWTRIPPFRFSIAFANVSDLLTDKRVYGKLFWYAGSYWNLYLQKNHIPQKSPANGNINNNTSGTSQNGSNGGSSSFQIGVYLHRANNGSSLSASKNGILNPDVFANNINYQTRPKKYSPNEPLSDGETTSPTTGSENIRRMYSNKLNGDQEKDNEFEDNTNPLLNFQDLQIGEVPLPSSSSSSTVAAAAAAAVVATHPAHHQQQHHYQSHNSTSSQPSSLYSPVKPSSKSDKTAIEYEDPRTSIPVYFIIFTPSRREKSTITSFLSVPNSFNKSQSWGWKSNSMCIFNEDGSFPPNHDPHLKFSIVLGNV